MTLLLDRSFESWSEWTGSNAGRLEVATMVRGGPKSRRVVALVGSPSDDDPMVVIKGSPLSETNGSLTAEYRALERVLAAVSPGLAETIPRPLELFEIDGWQFLATSCRAGRPIEPPKGDRTVNRRDRRVWKTYVTSVFEWTSALAAETRQDASNAVADMATMVDTFAELVPDDATGQQIRVVADSLRSSTKQWQPAWQHGDVAAGNVLTDRGTLRMVDWERASESSPAWRDLAYLPIVSVMLAHHQTGRTDVVDSLTLLDTRNWVGGMIKEQASALWPGPLSTGWGVFLTTVDTALTVAGRGDGRESPWVRAATLMATDKTIRSQIPWICPQW